MFAQPAALLFFVAKKLANRKPLERFLELTLVRRDHAGEHLAWGIVSDLDLMRALNAGATAATAGQVAASEVVAIGPRDTLADAVRLMHEHDTAHLVVASPESGRPVGMLSTLDIARAIDKA
jgi:CBS domain-containing protein